MVTVEKAPAADGGRYKGESDPRGRGKPRPYKRKKKNQEQSQEWLCTCEGTCGKMEVSG